MVFLDVLLCWSNFHNNVFIVAVHSVAIDSNHHLNVGSDDPSMQIISDQLTDNHSLKRQKRVLVFRPLFVYKQQQKEKQKMREIWEAQQELNQQQYQSNYEQQYYQQYLQNYYDQFAPSAGYYPNYNQPNYPFNEPSDPYSSVNDEQSNYWIYNPNNYYNPYQHADSSSSYYQSSTIADSPRPNHYYNSLPSDYR